MTLPANSEKSDLRILVIDDEVNICEILAQYLSDCGHHVDVASNGEEGLSKMRGGAYNLVICDLYMPGMGGIETLERIKELDENIEVILITGHCSIESAVESMKKGAYDYLSKPFNLEELEILINRAVEKRNMHTLVGLYEVSRLIFSSLDTEEILKTVVDTSARLLAADDTSIILLDKSGRLHVAASSDHPRSEESNRRMAMCERVAEKIAASRHPVIINAAADGSPAACSIIQPIVTRNAMLGFLNANRNRECAVFTEHDLKKTSILASSIGQAIENANLYSELQRKITQLNEAYSELQSHHDKLIVAEKLSALGKMTAGVAHELNNPLTVMVGFTEHLLGSGDMSDKSREILSKVNDSALRCRRIIKNLLSFARMKGSEKTDVQLVVILKDIREFLSQEMKVNNIDLVMKVPGELPAVHANSDMLRQVILSIINNSTHAITSAQRPGEISVTASSDSRNVLLTFKDNGQGISRDNLRRIFDPFFTTKRVGEGAGLGLSACYGIVEDCGGHIRAESTEGQGTTIYVELPVSASSASETREETTSIVPEAASLKLLVVDDEEMICDLYGDVLRSHGYNVETTTNSNDGLERILRGSYDLIILDWRMPGMDGKEIYETVASQKPDFASRVIFISGDTVNIDQLRIPNSRFLLKPFKVDELLETINSFCRGIT